MWVADESPVGEDDTETGGGEEMIMASPAWGDGQDVSLDFPRSVSQPVPHLSSFSRPTTRSTSREPTSNWCVCVCARVSEGGEREKIQKVASSIHVRSPSIAGAGHVQARV